MAAPDGLDVDAEITGSHEDFWTFSQVSQWGSNWPFFRDQDAFQNQVRGFVYMTRQLGLKNNYDPREVHFAQSFLWRFYIRESDTNKYPSNEMIPLAFESASLLLERTKSHREEVWKIMHSNEVGRPESFKKQHFEMLQKLNFNARIRHPSEFLHEFVTSRFGEKQLQLAECIISDSFLCACCLVHTPRCIAEGAAIMAAGMTNVTGAVAPKTVEALSFIRDMKYFYEQSIQQTQK